MNRQSWTSWLVAALLVFGQAASAMPLTSNMSDAAAETAAAADGASTEASMDDCHSRVEKMTDPAQMIMDSSCPENCVYCAASCVGVAVAISPPLSLLFSSAEPYAGPISSPAQRITGLFRPPITA